MAPGDTTAATAAAVEMDTTPAAASDAAPLLGQHGGRTSITVQGTVEETRQLIGDASDSANWLLVRRSRNRRPNNTTVEDARPSQAAPSTATTTTAEGNAAKCKSTSSLTRAQFIKKVNATMEKAARMPSVMDRDEAKVIVRPRGGLVIADLQPTALKRAIVNAAGIDSQTATEDTLYPNTAQNIVVISTPDDDRALKYARIRCIVIDTKAYEVFAYGSLPDYMVKGVIHNIGLQDTQEDIIQNLSYPFNSTFRAARRIGMTKAVVIAFEADKIPQYVIYAGVAVKCTAYKQHREVCKLCGQVGHRRDVCPTPEVNACFACGLRNPGPDHTNDCKPNCKLCNGAHPTGDPRCKNRFKTSFQTRKHAREEKKKAAEATKTTAPKVRLSRRDDFPKHEGVTKTHRSPSARSASRQRSGSTVRSALKNPTQNNTKTWAKIATAAPANAGNATAQSKRAQRQRSATRKRDDQEEKIAALEKIIQTLQATNATLTKRIETLTLKIEGKTNATAAASSRSADSHDTYNAPAEMMENAEADDAPQQPLQQPTNEVEEEEINEEETQEIEPPRKRLQIEEIHKVTTGRVAKKTTTSTITHNRAMKGLEGYLLKRQDDFEARIVARMDNLEALMDARMSDLEARMDARMGRVEQTLLEIQRTLALLSAKITGTPVPEQPTQQQHHG